MFDLLADAVADATFAKAPTPDLALLAAARGAASALSLPPVVDTTACAEAPLTNAPTLVFADRASAFGATRANEAKLPLAATTAGA